jgi:hypothetical protein
MIVFRVSIWDFKYILLAFLNKKLQHFCGATPRREAARVALRFTALQ